MAHDLLVGLRVVEYARGLGAAYCGRLLAEAGAEVIAVEPPGGSEPRRLGPFVHDRPGPDRGLPFIYTGVNKRSLTLALATTPGRDLFLRLLATADAFIEDAPPGHLATLGIDDEAVVQARRESHVASSSAPTDDRAGTRYIAPLPTALRLIWTSLTPFGQTGPYRDLASSPLVLQALSGWLSVSGEPDREPVQVGGRVAELATGLPAAAATLGALLDWEADADDSPLPLHTDVAELEAMVTWHPPFELASSYRGGWIVGRSGNRLPSTHPFTIVPCNGGKEYVGAIHLTHTQWELLCRMMEIDELLDEPELQTGAGRVANADRIDAAMRPWLLARSAEECFHTAQSWRIPFALVPDAAAILASPQHAARGYFAEMQHPEAGRYRAPGPAFQPAGAVISPDRPAPSTGQDTDAVLGELGLDTLAIAALRREGIV